jgi:PAS domain S-box-containing protein
LCCQNHCPQEAIFTAKLEHGKIQVAALTFPSRIPMQFQYTPYVLPVIIASAFAAWIAFYSWQRRAARNAVLLLLLALALTEWLIFYALQISDASLQTKVFWGEAKYLGVATTPLFWLFFAIQYANLGRQTLTWRWMTLLAAVPVLTSLLAVTTQWHGLFWSAPQLVQSVDFSDFSVIYGPWYWVHVGYSYLLILTGTIFVFRSLHHRQGLHRWQAIALIVSVLAPWLGNILYFSGYNPIPYLDLTPFAFVITVAALTWAILGFRLMDLAPIARDLIVDEMKDGMIVIDTQGQVVDINASAERLINRVGSQAIGNSLAAVLAPWPELVERYRNVTEAVDEISVGAGRWFELQISPLRDRHGQFLGRVIVLRDITARKEIENALSNALQQAQEANRLKSQLLARVSHELRTPLGGVLGFAELLQLDSYGALNEEQRDAATQILASANDLDNMIGQLLDQAQLDSETLVLHNRLFSLSPALQEVTDRMIELAREKGLAFYVEIAPNLPPSVYGDDSRIKQILSNLIDNAIKFTMQGRVDLNVYRLDSGHWAFKVSDTGPGISEGAQAYVFESFRQENTAITRDNRGAGLGLSITKSLIELMKGEIHLESKPGEGSTFTVILPLAERGPVSNL